ncbi:MAG: RND family transporter [Bacteroidales bacterium]|nr:RND family transporter [Bacteroidales bacterium]
MSKEIFVIKHRWLIIILALAIVAGAVFPLMQTKTNSDLKSYLPESMPSNISNAKIEEVFGKDELLIILFESDDVLNEATLRRIRSLSREFNRMKDFDMVMSLFDAKSIKGESGAMIVDPVVKRIPGSESRRERLREQIMSNELAYGLVVSEDFRYTAVILNSVTDKSDRELMATINTTLENNPGSEEVTMFGQPYLRNEANTKIANDAMLLLPVGLLVMIVFLMFSFRQKRGAVLPFMVVVFSIVIAMAVIPLLGWQMSIIGILVPIMMIAIANNYGVHFITRFQELNARHPRMSMKHIVTDVTTYLKKPVVLTGLTTMVGVSGLITHIMLPAKQMGVASVIGVGCALLLSLTLIPAIMVLLKKGRVVKSATGSENTFFNRILNGIAWFATRNPRQVIYIFAAFLIVAVFGLSRFRVAADYNNLFPGRHPYIQALHAIDKHFGGAKTINIMFEGDIKDPSILKRMDYYGHELEKMPQVGNVNSIAKVIRIMSRAINDPADELYGKIPGSREAVAQYLELYSMSGDPEDFEDLVDFDYTKALMTVQYRANDMKTLKEVEEKINSLTKNDRNVSVIGGFSLIEKELSQSIAKGQVYSLLFAFLAIMILLIIIFRSLSAGLLGSIPLFFTVFSIFGMMGWLGIELDIVTALLSSISIGLGVDYSIHLFWRLKTELKNGRSYAGAITESLKTIGRGITINALSVIIGFSVLFLSAFPFIHAFAFLITLSIFLCLTGALILIPAICMLIEPKFLKVPILKT